MATQFQTRAKRGFTLVELLVASTILVVAIVAVVSTIRKGGELQVIDRHFRMARSIINSTLESSNYAQGNYAFLTGTNLTVTIDPRTDDAGDDLTGTLVVTITPGTINGTNATAIAYKIVSMTLT